MQITAEIMQAYDLLKYAIARSNGSNSPYNKIQSALHNQEWSDEKVERPKRKRQMYKCQKP